MKTIPSLFWQWFAVACFVGVVAVQISTVVRERREQQLTGLDTAGSWYRAGIVAPMFVWDFFRLQAVRAAHPDAFVASSAVFPELVSQMYVLAGLVGLPLVRVSYGRHVVVVIGSKRISYFVGGSKPKVLFAASGLRLVAARIVRPAKGSGSSVFRGRV